MTVTHKRETEKRKENRTKALFLVNAIRRMIREDSIYVDHEVTNLVEKVLNHDPLTSS